MRVVAATNRDLEAMVATGTFREDLYYRLHVIEVRVAAAARAQRGHPGAHRSLPHALRRALPPRAQDGSRARRCERLVAYDWPGNVRQLEHVLLNAWLMSEGSEIATEDLRAPRRAARRATRSAVAVEPRLAHAPALEGRVQDRASASASCRRSPALNWNRVRAAKLIGIPRRTFYRRLKEYGILV